MGSVGSDFWEKRLFKRFLSVKVDLSRGKVEIIGGIINTTKFSVFCQFYNVRMALFDS